MDYFNFCDSRLNPTIFSSAVSAEGYEVINLVSNDSSKIKKGFMVYHTINPPVDVYVNFICKINISHIIIWPQVGNQKSCGFQIYTCSKCASSESHQSFINVGTGFLQKEPGIAFYNVVEPSSGNIKNFKHQRLFSKNNSLCAVNSLQIRILRTQHSSVPALQKVEVWGLPSVSCPKEVRMKVLSMWTKKDEVCNFVQSEKKDDTEERALRSTAKALVTSDLEIPEDFLDPITCEIMVLPFTLPCGKVIDQITLEKHENHEANWGRRPCDPFTGKLFTETSKPLFDVALKSRIDKFLIEHSDFDEIKKVPRTVGRDSQMKDKCVMIDKFSLGIMNIQNNSLKCIEEKSPAASKNREYKHQTCIKNKSTQDECPEKSRKKVKLLDNASSSNAQPNVSLSDCVKPCESQLLRSHEDVLNDSLNAALKNALSCLPSFTNFNQTVTVTEDKCSECDGKEILYILPCKHFLCRTCLTKKTKEKQSTCSFCKSIFDTSDPKRFHS